MFALLPTTVIDRGLGYNASSPAGKVSPSWRSSHRHHQPTADVRRRVTIYRDSLQTPWGFRLQGGKDFNTPLSVKRVFSGSPAVGQLTRDDLILAINDESVDGLFHAEVLEKIKSAGNSIVLTIETSALESGDFGYANQDHFQPVRGTSHQQQLCAPVEKTLQSESNETPSASSYDASPTTYETSPTTYETPPDTYETSPTTYESSPTTYDTSPTTYEIADPSHNLTTANVHNPKITTHQSRHRSAKRFQNASTMPSGLSEPGWVPRPKSVPRNLPLSTPQPPSSQYRSPQATSDQSVHYPSYKDYWKPDSGSAGGSGVPAWYGSLRSTRAPHSWEVRAAKVQIESEQEFSDAWKEPEQPQHTQVHQAQRRQVEPQQIQPEPSRTFKAEIRGLILARPAYPHSQSTPDWVDAPEERLYRSQDYTHSAPETPVADATSYQDSQTSPSASYTQQTEESPPVKLQPSLLFGDRSGRGVQQPSSQSRVTIRAQPQATKTTVSGVHARQEVSKGVAQLVTPPTIVPVQQAVSVSQAQANPPQAHPIIQPKAPGAVAKPSVQNQVKPSQEQPSTIKVSAQPAKLTYVPEIVERFNPGPDRQIQLSQSQVKHDSLPKTVGKLSTAPVERFNPGPDRQIHFSQTQVKHDSVPKTVGKLSTAPVERFNPGPDRQIHFSQTQVKHGSVPKTVGKLSTAPVERFNPGPDRQIQFSQTQVKHGSVPKTDGKLPTAPVERFNPGPDRQIHFSQTQVKHGSVPKTDGKLPTAPVERFNPGPDRQVHISQTQVKHDSVPKTVGKLSTAPVERFNPGPDRQIQLSQTTVKHSSPQSAKLPTAPVERFNPGPDRQNKA